MGNRTACADMAHRCAQAKHEAPRCGGDSGTAGMTAAYSSAWATRRNSTEHGIGEVERVAHGETRRSSITRRLKPGSDLDAFSSAPETTRRTSEPLIAAIPIGPSRQRRQHLISNLHPRHRTCETPPSNRHRRPPAQQRPRGNRRRQAATLLRWVPASSSGHNPRTRGGERDISGGTELAECDQCRVQQGGLGAL